MAKKRIMKDFQMTEISTVDRPAQKPAKMTIMKRQDTSLETIAKYYSDGSLGSKDFKTILDANKKSKKLWEARDELYPLFNALNDSISSIVTDTALSDESRNGKIEQSVNDFLSAVKSALPDVEEELQKFFEDITAESLGKSQTLEEGTDMSDLETKITEAVEKATKELTEKLEKANSELLVAKAEAAMTDEEKTFVAKMDAKAKEDWAKLSDEDKKKKMGDVKKNDETVTVGGELVSKAAVGEGQFAILKRLADAETRIAKAEELAEMATLEKRAASEFAHLPGTDAEKAKLLKALGSADADVAAFAEGILKAADGVAKEAFVNKGVSKGVAEGSAEDKLEKAAKEIQKSEPKLTKEQALVKAYEANPELVAEVK